MGRLLKILAILFSLYVIEAVVSFIFLEFYYFVTEGIELPNFIAYLKIAIFLTWTRILFYFILHVAILFWLSNKIHIENKLMKMILLNCSIYITLSLLFAFVIIPETKEWLTRPFFYILIISTGISPMLLNTIPYFKRTINSI